MWIVSRNGNEQKFYIEGFLVASINSFVPEFNCFEIYYPESTNDKKNLKIKITYLSDVNLEERDLELLILSQDYEQVLSSKKGDFLIEEFYENTVHKEICTWKNGRLEGHRKLFYPSSFKKTEQKYVNGLLEGEFKSFYDTKENLLMCRGISKNGELNGIYEKYKENGEASEQIFHNNGTLE